jgi:hypothetical protein
MPIFLLLQGTCTATVSRTCKRGKAGNIMHVWLVFKKQVTARSGARLIMMCRGHAQEVQQAPLTHRLQMCPNAGGFHEPARLIHPTPPALHSAQSRLQNTCTHVQVHNLGNPRTQPTLLNSSLSTRKCLMNSTGSYSHPLHPLSQNLPYHPCKPTVPINC